MLSGKETISDVLEKYPETEKIISKYFKSMCLHCPMSTMETIEEGCKAHEVDSNKLIDELNQIISKGKGE